MNVVRVRGKFLTMLRSSNTLFHPRSGMLVKRYLCKYTGCLRTMWQIVNALKFYSLLLFFFLDIVLRLRYENKNFGKRFCNICLNQIKPNLLITCCIYNYNKYRFVDLFEKCELNCTNCITLYRYVIVWPSWLARPSSCRSFKI